MKLEFKNVLESKDVHIDIVGIGSEFILYGKTYYKAKICTRKGIFTVGISLENPNTLIYPECIVSIDVPKKKKTSDLLFGEFFLYNGDIYLATGPMCTDMKNWAIDLKKSLHWYGCDKEVQMMECVKD